MTIMKKSDFYITVNGLILIYYWNELLSSGSEFMDQRFYTLMMIKGPIISWVIINLLFWTFYKFKIEK